MKLWRKPATLIAFLAVFMAVGGAFFLRGALAATGTIYLSPASNSLQNGSSVTISLRINPVVNVDSVQGTVTFDASKLQFVSVNTAGSAFSTELQNTQGSGTVTFSRGDFGGGVTSDALIETITFKALVGSGSTSLGVSGANADSGGTFTNPGVSGATVSFTTPAPPPATCPAGQTGTPPNCVTPPPSTGSGSTGGGSSGGSSHSGGSSSGGSSSGGSSSGSSGSTGGSTPGGTSSANVTVTEKKIQFTQATITATSKTPTKVYVRFGVNGELATSTPVSDFATSHVITIDPTLLVPGQTYSYVVVATDQQGVTTQTAVETFATKGLKVSVGLADKNHQPLRNKTITLHSTVVTAKTDDKGFAVFSSVAPGTHHVEYVSGKKTYTATVEVANNVQTAGSVQTAPTQNVSVVFGLVQHGNWWASRAFVTILSLVVLAAVVGFFIRRNLLTAGLGSAAPVTSSPVVIDGATVTPPPAVNDVQQPAPAAQQTSEHLETIPYPNAPQPGNTIAPNPDDNNDGKEL